MALIECLLQLLEAYGLLLLLLSGVVPFDDQLLGHVQEGLVDIRAGLGGGLDDLEVRVFLLELLDVGVGDLDLLGGGVGLIREDDDGDVLPRVLLHLLHPGGHIQEGFLVAQVKNDNNPVRALIVGVRDRPIALLTRGVPDLQLDRRFVYLKGAESKVHPDRRDVVLAEAIIL